MIPLRDTLPSRSTPLVTSLLIAVNVAVFLFQLSMEDYSHNEFAFAHGLIPARIHLSSLVTYMFLHGGWMHIIGNMWFLWIFGDNVEDILGHGKFLVFYLACGIAAGLTQVLMSPGSRVPLVGASGAIAGVMGAYLIKFPHARILTLIPVFIFITPMEIPAYWILLYWFVLQIFSGVGSVGYTQISRGGVAWFAHIGGFLIGMLLITLMGTRERYRRRSDLYW